VTQTFDGVDISHRLECRQVRLRLHQVTFDFASARLAVADTNADQKLDLADVEDGDVVLVQARTVEGSAYAAPAEDEEPTPTP
jgi:hypothetical protein